MTNHDGDLPGLEPDLEPAQRPEAPRPPIHDIEPTTYGGLTNAELDTWFDEVYGGQDRFDKEFKDPTKSQVKPFASLEKSGTPIDDGWRREDWHRLGPELKAEFKRYVESRAEATTPPGKDAVIIGGTIATLILGAIVYFGTKPEEASVAAGAGPVAEAPAPGTPDDSESGTPPEDTADGADPTGDMLGSPGNTGEDNADAAASDITATAYFLDGTTHVFQMKVRGNGEALAAGDVRWYNPRFILQTPQGEFTIDVDATDGTARLIDGPFTDASEIQVEVDWLEPGCLQVAATIIGLTDAATSFRTELTVRLADGTDYSDDASFGE